MKKALKPFENRALMLHEQRSQVPPDRQTRMRQKRMRAADKSKNTMIKEDELLYARMCTGTKQIEEDVYDTDLVDVMKEKKKIRLYDVDAIQQELKELTEDEDDNQ